MGNVLYLTGVILAVASGILGLPWFFILLSSSVMVLGYLIIRAPQIYVMINAQGIIVLPKLLAIQIAVHSIVTAPLYFISSLFS